MRTSLVAIALLSQASIAEAAKFAVACTGTGYSEHNLTGTVRKSTTQLPLQIYVIDEEKESVQRALMPRQEFDTICSSEKGAPFVSISPGLILVSGAPDYSETSVECRLELDRKSGKASHLLKMNLGGERYNELRWEMMCEKTSIPVFKPDENKF
jgi:hypothetical protein